MTIVVRRAFQHGHVIQLHHARLSYFSSPPPYFVSVTQFFSAQLCEPYLYRADGSQRLAHLMKMESGLNKFLKTGSQWYTRSSLLRFVFTCYRRHNCKDQTLPPCLHLIFATYTQNLKTWSQSEPFLILSGKYPARDITLLT